MPELPPKQMILLSEAVVLTGKNESTIRRYFKKPENKPYTATKGGKVYIDREHLLKQYGASQTPELPPESPGSAPKQTPEQNPAIDAAMQALISQLEAKDMQIASLMERLKESNINTNRLLQASNPQEEVPPVPPQKSFPLFLYILAGLAVALLLVLFWMIYQQSTSQVQTSGIGQSAQNVKDRTISNVMINRETEQNIETDTTEAAPVSMPGAIEE